MIDQNTGFNPEEDRGHTESCQQVGATETEVPGVESPMVLR